MYEPAVQGSCMGNPVKILTKYIPSPSKMKAKQNKNNKGSRVWRPLPVKVLSRVKPSRFHSLTVLSADAVASWRTSGLNKHFSTYLPAALHPVQPRQPCLPMQLKTINWLVAPCLLTELQLCCTCHTPSLVCTAYCAPCSTTMCSAQATVLPKIALFCHLTHYTMFSI